MSEFSMNLGFLIILIWAAEDLIQTSTMYYSQWYLDSFMRLAFFGN